MNAGNVLGGVLQLQGLLHLDPENQVGQEGSGAVFDLVGVVVAMVVGSHHKSVSE